MHVTISAGKDVTCLSFTAPSAKPQEQKELGQSWAGGQTPAKENAWDLVQYGHLYLLLPALHLMPDKVWIWALEPFACREWKKSSVMRENQPNRRLQLCF